MAENLPTWEACKENVLPIKRGRSARGLSSTLDRGVSGVSADEEREHQFQDEIAAAFEPKHLLDVYVQYFKWIRDMYPSNSDKALKLLEVDEDFVVFQ